MPTTFRKPGSVVRRRPGQRGSRAQVTSPSVAFTVATSPPVGRGRGLFEQRDVSVFAVCHAVFDDVGEREIAADPFDVGVGIAVIIEALLQPKGYFAAGQHLSRTAGATVAYGAPSPSRRCSNLGVLPPKPCLALPAPMALGFSEQRRKPLDDASAAFRSDLVRGRCLPPAEIEGSPVQGNVVRLEFPRKRVGFTESAAGGRRGWGQRCLTSGAGPSTRPLEVVKCTEPSPNPPVTRLKTGPEPVVRTDCLQLRLRGSLVGAVAQRSVSWRARPTLRTYPE